MHCNNNHDNTFQFYIGSVNILFFENLIILKTFEFWNLYFFYKTFKFYRNNSNLKLEKVRFFFLNIFTQKLIAVEESASLQNYTDFYKFLDQNLNFNNTLRPTEIDKNFISIVFKCNNDVRDLIDCHDHIELLYQELKNDCNGKKGTQQTINRQNV